MKTAHLLPEECKQEIAALLEMVKEEGALVVESPYGPLHAVGFTDGFNNALKWVLEEEK